MTRLSPVRFCASLVILTTALPALGQTTAPATKPADPGSWTLLFNGHNLDGFYTFIKTPGKNSDSQGYFKVENGAIHVMGFPVAEEKRDFGYIATEKECDNYHLRFQYKWGEKKHLPRDKAKRDAGVLYHVNGQDKVWPQSLECQVQEGDTGDLWIVGDNLSVATTVQSLDAKDKVFKPDGLPFVHTKGRIIKDPTADSLTEWNTVEVIAKDNSSAHIVNGKIVNRVSDAQFVDSKHPLNRGRIAFQAEGAEVFYRNIEIRPLKDDEALPTTQPAQWQVNDRSRPRPAKIEPMSESSLADSSKPPAGAIVLFDGTDLSKWQDPKWKLENGCVESVRKGGNLVSKGAFGSCRLHVEWRTPSPAKGKDQNQGNSGVFLMSTYEMQVLDNTNNPTYADGFAGAVYGENPPLLDACRASGEWNYYDITFHRPIFSADGRVARTARVAALLNGMTVQENFELTGPTSHQVRTPYSAHADRMPLMLQEHSGSVQFRNIWLVPVGE